MPQRNLQYLLIFNNELCTFRLDTLQDIWNLELIILGRILIMNSKMVTSQMLS